VFSCFVSDLIVYQTRRTGAELESEKIIDEQLFAYDQMQGGTALLTFRPIVHDILKVHYHFTMLIQVRQIAARLY
jgi:hypothetical protein